MSPGADWLSNFWWDFFSKKKKFLCRNEIADQKKKKMSLKKNSKELLPPPKQKISTNQADLKKKKGHDAEGPRGIFPTSLYGQSAPG
jgi:hypothetical protein